MNKIKFFRLRDVKMPTRAYEGSAGIDIFVPNTLDEDFCEVFGEVNKGNHVGINLFSSIEIKGSSQVAIPSGLKVKFDEGYSLIAFNKSGVVSKSGLAITACVVDQDYEGELIIFMYNLSRRVMKVEAGSKITQLILIPTPSIEIEELDSFSSAGTKRGEGKQGSSGSK